MYDFNHKTCPIKYIQQYEPLYAGHEVLVFLGQHDATAPAAVDVHPQSVLLAHVGDGIERVERAQHRRARRRHHQERRATLKQCNVLVAGALGQLHQDATTLVHKPNACLIHCECMISRLRANVCAHAHFYYTINTSFQESLPKKGHDSIHGCQKFLQVCKPLTQVLSKA